MKRHIKTYNQYLNEDVRHEGEMWNVYVGKKLVGVYDNRKDARAHNDKLKKQKTR